MAQSRRWAGRYRRGEPHEGAGGRRKAPDAQLGVQKEGRDLGAVQQVLQVAVDAVEVLHLSSEFGVHRLQFFVERLQFLL